MNLVKEVEIWSRPPDEVSVGVEIPKDSRTKYKRKWDAIHLERVLLAPLRCSGEYGFIPQTYRNDKGPLEAIVVIDEPTYPGCSSTRDQLDCSTCSILAKRMTRCFACLSTI